MQSSRELRLTDEAESDLMDISAYTLTQWGESQMYAYTERIFESLLLLREFPERGRARSDLQRDLRSFPVGEHVAYYRASATEIVVRRILHSRQKATRRYFRNR